MRYYRAVDVDRARLAVTVDGFLIGSLGRAGSDLCLALVRETEKARKTMTPEQIETERRSFPRKVERLKAWIEEQRRPSCSGCSQ